MPNICVYKSMLIVYMVQYRIYEKCIKSFSASLLYRQGISKYLAGYHAAK